MAGDLRRAAAAVSACARVVCSAGVDCEPVAQDDLVGVLVDRLSTVTVGLQRDVVLEVCAEWAERRVLAALDAAAVDVAHLSGLPVAAVRTPAGQRAALRAAGVKPPAQLHLAAVESLPGTPVVLALVRLRALEDLADQLDRGRWAPVWAAAWDAESRQGSFDETVAALLPRFPRASELGWALIAFETHKHVNLIWHQANKLVRSFPDRSAADLLGWGWVGLRTALRLFDPDLGFAFSTYACSRVIGAIRDGVRSENPVPKRLNTFTRKVAAVEAELAQTLGRPPTLEEVSASVGVELASLDVLRRTAPAASVEEIVSGLGDRGVVPRWLVASEDTESAALSTVRRDAIVRALEQLPPVDAEAVRLLVMEGLNPTEARAVTGATARQLRQRKERGLAALRENLNEWAESSAE